MEQYFYAELRLGYNNSAKMWMAENTCYDNMCMASSEEKLMK